MAVQTNSQKMAQAAYLGVVNTLEALRKEDRDRYTSFAREFPSLVHSCGLAQAVAFARSKHRKEYLEDFAAVLNAIGHPEAASTENLEKATREHDVPAYVRLSRNALRAASWLKRYVDAETAEQE